MADSAPKTQIKSDQSDHENPSKFFLYKVALVTLFLVLVPLFPSLAPDFFNQTSHATSWELLQLIFVGIAVSYGLFSKKNDGQQKDYNHISKIDNAQLYLSKLLQVSSLLDDESESNTVIEENKIQALSSQYYRGEPVVVVAKENPSDEEQNGVVARISQKPLLLPVRSLKQRLPSPNSRDGGFERLNAEEAEREEEKVVFRSPIPWRSRSGRMKMKEISSDEEINSPSMEEERELNRNDQSRPFRSFRSNPNSSLSSSSSSPKSSQSKSGEDVVRKKSFAPPPPAPPPPPPPSPAFLRKSVLMKSNSSIGSSERGSNKKALGRSARSVPSEELSETEMDELMRCGVENEKASMDNTEEEEESGPDVDKKADEFIAKFREQIRLQRIEAIRISTGQRAGKNSS